METRCVLGWYLLCLLSASECIPQNVIGIEGQNVTLPCKYNTKNHGVSAICWGTGVLPNSGCYKEIISTDGTKVTQRSSVRYNLLGELKTGDVSLTIFNVTEKDSGQYGCRVHVYGLWNDEKYQVSLNIAKAPVPTTSQAPAKVTITQQTMDNHTHGHVTTHSIEYSDTSTPPYSESESEQMRGHKLSVILVYILLVLTGVLIVPVLVVLITGKRWRTIATVVQIPQHSDSSILYRKSESSLDVHTRDMAVENVYEINDNEGDDYEECP